MSKRQTRRWRRCKTTWRRSTHVIALPPPLVWRTCYRTLWLVFPVFFSVMLCTGFNKWRFLHCVISVRMRRSSWTSLKLTWLASAGELRASSSLNLAIPPPPSKASCQSRQCVTLNKWRLVKAPAPLSTHVSLYLLLRLFLFCFWTDHNAQRRRVCTSQQLTAL